MIALRNMFVLTVLLLSVLSSTFARVYLLDGSTDQSSSDTPQTSPLLQPQLNTSIFIVNHTTTQPPPPPKNHPTNITIARQIDFDNPIYYQEEASPSSVKTDQLTYNETNFTYGNINLRRSSPLNGDSTSSQEHALKTAVVSMDKARVPISRQSGMSALQIAHLMNSGVRLEGQMGNRRQHLSARPSGPLMPRPIYAKPPNGYSNRHTISAQIKHGPSGYQYQVPGNLSKQYYETSRRPVHSPVGYKTQKRQPLMPNAERFRPSRPKPIHIEPVLFLKTNISSAFQRQFDQIPKTVAFKQPVVPLNFGQDSKATGDESLENYQTLGANLGASPKRIYRPAQLTGPFYTYPNVKQRPTDSKILPSQIFTPGRTPNFAHGNLGDRYPLRQNPQVISTSLKNTNPISLPPNALQNINFATPGQLQVLQVQPEGPTQFASGFPTLSQQTNQFDQGVAQYVPSNPSSSPARYPFRPTLEPVTPTKISSSILNAGHGLSGRNPYQQQGETPTLYKVQGTYTEQAKPEQQPIKPSIQYDEVITPELSAILKANYRPQEIPPRLKPEESEIRFKPEDAASPYKPEEVYKYKPNQGGTRFKPQKETGYKSEESSYDFTPQDGSNSKYKANNRPSLPGPPYDDDEEIQSKYTPEKPIVEQEEYTYQDSPSSYDAPINPKHTYKDTEDDDDKSPSYPPYPPSKDAGPGSVQDILAGSSGRIPSTSYGVPDASLHGNSYDPHGGGHKKGGHVHTFVKTTKEGHFKWGVRHSVAAH